MEEYGKNGKMSLEEVLELYNGQEDEDKKEDIDIPEDSQAAQETQVPVHREREEVLVLQKQVHGSRQFAGLISRYLVFSICLYY